MLNFAGHFHFRPASPSADQALWKYELHLYRQELETTDGEVSGISWHRTQAAEPCYIKTCVLEGIWGLAYPEKIHTHPVLRPVPKVTAVHVPLEISLEKVAFTKQLQTDNLLKFVTWTDE